MELGRSLYILIRAKPFRVEKKYPNSLSQGFKANAPTPCGLPARGPRPGLELANTFGVKTLSEEQEEVDLLRSLR